MEGVVLRWGKCSSVECGPGRRAVHGDHCHILVTKMTQQLWSWRAVTEREEEK